MTSPDGPIDPDVLDELFDALRAGGPAPARADELSPTTQGVVALLAEQAAAAAALPDDPGAVDRLVARAGLPAAAPAVTPLPVQGTSRRTAVRGWAVGLAAASVAVIAGAIALESWDDARPVALPTPVEIPPPVVGPSDTPSGDDATEPPTGGDGTPQAPTVTDGPSDAAAGPGPGSPGLPTGDPDGTPSPAPSDGPDDPPSPSTPPTPDPDPEPRPTPDPTPLPTPDPSPLPTPDPGRDPTPTPTPTPTPSDDTSVPGPSASATDDTATARPGQTIVVDVLANDEPAGGLDSETLRVVEHPTAGTARIADGQIEFVAPKATGTQQIVYEVCTAEGSCDRATLVVDVTESPGSDPTAVDDTATVAGSGPVVIDVLANDEDVDGDLDPASLQVVVEPTVGVAEVVARGIRYTADTSAGVEQDSFRYRVCDATGRCAEATVTVTIDLAGSNTPVDAIDDEVVVEEPDVWIDVLANDLDPDAAPNGIDPTTLALLEPPTSGEAMVEDGLVHWIAEDPLVPAMATFVYEVCDGAGSCDEAVVTVLYEPPA